MKFKGVITALVTLLTDDDEVDYDGLYKLIDYQLANGVQGLLILGGTGEYFALTSSEKKTLIKLTVDYEAGRVPVLVGLLSPGLGENIELGQCAKRLGADAVMVIAPFYVTATEQGFLDYYKCIERNVDMPIVLYNIPYKTGVNLPNATVVKLVESMANVVGIKVCSDNIGDVIELTQKVGDRISILCGEDYRAVYSFISEAAGCVVASSNLLPDVWSNIWSQVNKGMLTEAVALHHQYFPLMNALFKESNPAPLKVALNEIGITVGHVRPPLTTIFLELRTTLKSMMEELNLF